MEKNETEGFLFSPKEFELSKEQENTDCIPPKKKRGRHPKPAIFEPRPDLTMEKMREKLEDIKDITTTMGIKYVKLRLTAKMIIGVRESSGKEFTINLYDLYKAYLNCPRFTSPVVKKYIFMGHSPAVAILRLLQQE